MLHTGVSGLFHCTLHSRRRHVFCDVNSAQPKRKGRCLDLPTLTAPCDLRSGQTGQVRIPRCIHKGLRPYRKDSFIIRAGQRTDPVLLCLCANDQTMKQQVRL